MNEESNETLLAMDECSTPNCIEPAGHSDPHSNDILMRIKCRECESLLVVYASVDGLTYKTCSSTLDSRLVEAVLREQLVQKIEALGTLMFCSDDKEREVLPKSVVLTVIRQAPLTSHPKSA